MKDRNRIGRRFLAAVACGSAALLLLAAVPVLRAPRPETSIRKALALGNAHDFDCDKCHSLHASDQAEVYPNALAGPNDNGLCFSCHQPWSGASFGGDALYRGTDHGSDPDMIWPGPTPPPRVEADAATKCLNCHDPHGWTDPDSLVPHLALAREENLCLTCHDGHPAQLDIRSELMKPYRHPVTDHRGRHVDAGESDPTSFGRVPLNSRHAECEDCHNPHVSRGDTPPPAGTTADASKLVLGVSRVVVLNGGPGAAPNFTFVAGSDTLTGPPAEYQLCFKCHSSWTTAPSGQTDLALVLNPANPSYHPVEATTRDLAVDPQSFVNGWRGSSVTRCGDCHGSDNDAAPRGPHGSIWAGLLRRESPASAGPRTMNPNELCFSCHSYDVYANPTAPEMTRAHSRFNAPAGAGHAEHVGAQQVPCYSCHVTHGSTTQPSLIALGRSPGIVSFTATPTGGTCTPTCHAARTYTLNYAR